LSAVQVDPDAIVGLRAGVFRPAWSRLVIELNGPMAIRRSEMVTQTAAAQVDVLLVPSTQAEFAQIAAAPEPPEWQLPKSIALPEPKKQGAGPLVVVLDAGHGGLDPGAQRDGYNEADLVLTFARELKEILLRDGGFSVVMTRDGDEFVPLETRISIARAAGADVFLSLHADSVTEGEAVGATVYSLSETASDKASQTLAERHDRDDLLAGVDLTAQDDLVAQVLMDMARTQTVPRTASLSKNLAAAIAAAGIKMHRHPEQGAGFSVLKSPDIPSVLLELGFLSSAQDLTKLTDPAWRVQMAEAVRFGLVAWADQDRLRRAQPLQ
jgi:N-acetylmuramoyl-L-alanine amidase